MRKLIVLAVFAVGLLMTAVVSIAVAGDDDGGSAQARLNGYNEVTGPPNGGSISTVGSGRLQLSIQGSTITYRLTYTLENPATQAHIHFAQRHVNGGIVAFLCGGAPPSSNKPACPSGVDSQATVTGTIVPTDIIGPAGQGIEPASFAEAVRAIRAGAAYGNVHSSRFPAGEIRGQLRSGGDDDEGND
jgi:CHRD domain-containing protein